MRYPSVMDVGIMKGQPAACHFQALYIPAARKQNDGAKVARDTGRRAFSMTVWYNTGMETKEIMTSTAETVTIPRTEYEELLELKKQHAWMLEQLRVVRKKQFGPSSEKATEEVSEQLSLLFNEAEVYADEDTAASEKHSVIEVRSHTRQRKSGSARDILPEDVEVIEVEHTLPEEERLCPQCGETMQPIGTEVRETVQIIPAKAVLHRDIYYNYGCGNCKENDISTPILKTPKEPALIPGSGASAEAVAHIAVQKFVMGSPLYRQEQEWNRQGVLLSRQTMSNWLLRCI